MFNKSSFLFATIICISLVAHHECHGVKAFLMDKIVNPIKSILPHHHHHHEENLSDNNVEVGVDSKERGSLDNIARDILREGSRTFKQIKDTIKGTFSSKDTQGLDCNKTLTKNGDVENFKSTVRAIYPGTKWCGDGNISKSFDDLGKFATTDSCCREHDVCPDNMDAGSTKYGLKNTGLFTRSHCDCDSKFYNCLKQAHSIVADSIGYTYFTILGPQCFRQDYPIVECEKEVKGKCLKYLTEREGERIHQWFDSPTF